MLTATALRRTCCLRFSRAALVLGLPCSRLYAALEACQSRLLYSHGGVSPISRFAAPFPVPGRIGKRGVPDSRSRPNRESGIPSESPVSGGNGNWGFPAGLLALPVAAGSSDPSENLRTVPPAEARPMIQVSLTSHLRPAQSLPCQPGPPYVVPICEVLPGEPDSSEYECTVCLEIKKSNLVSFWIRLGRG
jgi:hypothetical protein